MHSDFCFRKHLDATVARPCLSGSVSRHWYAKCKIKWHAVVVAKRAFALDEQLDIQISRRPAIGEVYAFIYNRVPKN